MSVFLKDISFHGILLDSLFLDDNKEWRQVKKLVNEGIKSGVVKPLNYTCYKREKIEQAFRFMAAGKHHGKVVVEVRIRPITQRYVDNVK